MSQNPTTDIVVQDDKQQPDPRNETPGDDIRRIMDEIAEELEQNGGDLRAARLYAENHYGGRYVDEAIDRITENHPDLVDSVDDSDLVVSSTVSETEVPDFDAIDDDDPLVRALGTKSTARNTQDGLGEFLSDFIYEHDKAWAREFEQNSETALVRWCRLFLANHPDYGREWLTVEVEHTWQPDDPNRDAVTKTLTMPRSIEEILAAAKREGFDPTIEVDVYREEQEVVWQDNGIGMTLTEADEAFNENFNSGSALEADTGGKFGIGALTFALISGKQGAMEVQTRTRRSDVPDYNENGIRFYARLSGMTLLENSRMDDDFYGTKFKIPIQDEMDGGPNLDKIQTWVAEFGKHLRVPILYKEHRGSDVIVEEEYGGKDWTDHFDDPPVVVERPGEFSVVAGPDVVDNRRYGQSDPNTWLVSMPIDRNTRASPSTMWNFAVQIHDEQGRIVAGPHRGEYRQDVEGGEGLHEDDVVLPEPTGDRDRLQKDSQQKQFFNYVGKVVRQKEMANVADFATELIESDEPAEAVRGVGSTWDLFGKLLDYHGDRDVKNEAAQMANFFDEYDELPDLSSEKAEKITKLFTQIQVAPKNCRKPAKKKYRNGQKIGYLLAHDNPDRVFMAASTGGNFKDYYNVVYKTSSDYCVVKVGGANRYSVYADRLGWEKLTEVPVLQDDDHDFTVPDHIHSDNVATKGTSSSDGDSASTVDEKRLKLRTSSSNTSIDERPTVSDAKETLEDNERFGNKRNLILFRRGQERISDHYSMSEFAAIASVTKDVFDELKGYDRVFTLDEFTTWSYSTAIATEEGAKRPQELAEDDRLVVLAFVHNGHWVKRLLTEEKAGLRERLAEDRAAQELPYHSDDDPADTLFGVIAWPTLRRASYAFKQLRRDGTIHDAENGIVGLKFDYTSPSRANIRWKSLNDDIKDHRLKANTPEWDDDSSVYKKFPRKRDDTWRGQLLVGFHDAGVDPTEYSQGEIADLTATVDPSELEDD